MILTIPGDFMTEWISSPGSTVNGECVRRELTSSGSWSVGKANWGCRPATVGRKKGADLGTLGGSFGLLRSWKMEAIIRCGVLTMAHILWAQRECSVGTERMNSAKRQKDRSNHQVWRLDPGPRSVGTERMNTAKRQKDGSNRQAWCSDPGPHSVGTERMNTADSGTDGSCFYMLCDRNNKIMWTQTWIHICTDICTKINLNYSTIKLEKNWGKKRRPPHPPVSNLVFYAQSTIMIISGWEKQKTRQNKMDLVHESSAVNGL